MQKWSEQPPSADFIDIVLEVGPAILKRHASLLCKVLPPLLGFSLFVVYFYRNHFYPSFDLFQFSSLLLAAAFIGFAVVGLIVAALVLPGIMVFYSFLNTKAIKEDIAYAMPYAPERRGSKVIELIGITYFLPHLLTGLLFWLLALSLHKQIPLVALMIGVPVMVCLVFGCVLQQRFALSRYSAWSYMWASALPTMVILGLIVVVTKNLAPAMAHLPLWVQLFGVGGIALFVALISSVVAMAQFAGWHATTLFGFVFGLLLAGFSGFLSSLLELAVRAMGLGAYTATHVIFDPEFCTGERHSALSIQGDCSLTDAHIIWSLGETTVIRPNPDSPLQFQLPARFVQAIVKDGEL